MSWLTVVYLILIPILVGMFFFNRWLDSNHFQGWLFEWMVARRLAKRFPSTEWTLFRDITLEKAGKTSQLDLVLLSKRGLFVIECKNYSGWIFGTADQRRWTQTFFRKKFYFQNPLIQNDKHVQVLAEILELAPERLTSIVLFSRRSSIRTELPGTVCQGVDPLVEFVEGHRDAVFTAVEVSGIRHQLEQKRLKTGRATNRQHRKNVASRNTLQPTPPPPTGAEPACPKCSTPMVKRLGKSGALAGTSFWGCSTYPKCRQRVPIS